ncbi:MAG TPA: heavy-metal-associated domain-containing protein [Chloroflexota bacterium]
MNQISLTAPDISCEHCQHTIERELSALPGVETVSVEIPTKHVRVAFDPARTSEEAIIAKLDDEGYPVAP